MAVSAVFKIDGTDYTKRIVEGGIKWARNDLDSQESGRTLDGVMHRTRIASKIKLTISCMRMTTSQIQALNTALAPAFIKVTYLDPINGVITKIFYGSSVEATTQIVQDGETYWEGTTFDLIEQ
jgi:hypothetical protein